MKKKIKTANILHLLTKKEVGGIPSNEIHFSGKSLYDLICVLKLVIEEETYKKLLKDLKEILDVYNKKFHVVSLKDILLLGGFQGENPLEELLK